MRRLLRPTVCVLAVLMLGASGCALMHELKPHRLARWNYQPKLGNRGDNFSVDDPVADHHARSARRVSNILD